MISTVRKVVSIALLHFVTMIPHGLQEIDSKQNPEGSNSSKSGDFIYFERQFGEKLAQNTKQLFEGNWFQQINNSTLTKQQLNVAKSIAGQTGDELKMVIAKLYPTQPSTFVFSPIRISEDGQLVIAEVTWDSASDQFVIRNFFWNMFQYDGEVFVGAAHGDGILILKLELNKQREALVFRRFNPNAVRRMFESNEINVVEVPAIGGKATKIRNDQKLNFFLSRIRDPSLFEKQPFMSLHRAK